MIEIETLDLTNNDNKVLEDWLTFKFTNVHRGTSLWNDGQVQRHNMYDWRPRMYCLSCGSLWSMEIKSPRWTGHCHECQETKLRMLVCRCREVKTIKTIPIVWYRYSTWKGFVEETNDVWEYRLKQSDTGLTL